MSFGVRSWSNFILSCFLYFLFLIQIGSFHRVVQLSATFDVSTKAVFTLQLQKPFSIQAKLYPSAGFTVAVDSSASFIGIFSGGIKVSARVACKYRHDLLSVRWLR
jgi:hypothetical protein